MNISIFEGDRVLYHGKVQIEPTLRRFIRANRYWLNIGELLCSELEKS